MSIEWFLIVAELVDRLGKLSVLAVVGGVMILVAFFINNILNMEEISKPSKTLVMYLIISTLVMVIIPSKSTIYLVGGIHYSKTLLEGNRPLVDKSRLLLEAKLDEIIADMANKKEK